jgi:hypothetical protein
MIFKTKTKTKKQKTKNKKQKTKNKKTKKKHICAGSVSKHLTNLKSILSVPYSYFFNKNPVISSSSSLVKPINMTDKYNFETINKSTLGGCVKELIEESYKIYEYYLEKNKQTTIVCGGQSPSYYCLAMMNFSIYDPEKVNIIIIPHSKNGVKTNNYEDEFKENKSYCERLKEKNIDLINKNVVIIDGVHSGVGILALENALKHCFKNMNIEKIAINAIKNLSEIYVDKEIILPCEPLFSDTFPRLVNSYYPRDFDNGEKFITKFNLENNQIAQMIIDISKEYPNKKIEDNSWYKLNNELNENQKQIVELEKQIIELKKNLNEENQEKINKLILTIYKLSLN